MLITITVPDNLPQHILGQRIREIEENFRQEAVFFAAVLKKKEQTCGNDPWSDPDAELPSIDMGIEDFSINHDHYLYGTAKIS